MEDSLIRRIESKELVEGARREARATARIWMEVCGDRPIDTYSRADMGGFRDVTINKHLSRIGPFFDWFVKHGRMAKPQDVFWTGFHLSTGVA